MPNPAAGGASLKPQRRGLLFQFSTAPPAAPANKRGRKKKPPGKALGRCCMMFLLCSAKIPICRVLAIHPPPVAGRCRASLLSAVAETCISVTDDQTGLGPRIPHLPISHFPCFFRPNRELTAWPSQAPADVVAKTDRHGAPATETGRGSRRGLIGWLAGWLRCPPISPSSQQSSKSFARLGTATSTSSSLLPFLSYSPLPFLFSFLPTTFLPPAAGYRFFPAILLFALSAVSEFFSCQHHYFCLALFFSAPPFLHGQHVHSYRIRAIQPGSAGGRSRAASGPRRRCQCQVCLDQQLRG